MSRLVFVLVIFTQVRSGYGSGTQERSNGTGCVQERAASANRAGAAWSDRTYDCCTPVSLPHWARTADDISDALWCRRRWVWRCRSRVVTKQTRWRCLKLRQRTGWLTERRMLRMWHRAAKQLDTVRDTWVVIDMSLSIYNPRSRTDLAS